MIQFFFGGGGGGMYVCGRVSRWLLGDHKPVLIAINNVVVL